MDESKNFIKNVNDVASKLDQIIQSNQYYSEEVVNLLKDLQELDLVTVIEDLNKSSYQGKRKLDIDIEGLELTPEKETATKIVLLFANGISDTLVFKDGEVISGITSNAELFNALEAYTNSSTTKLTHTELTYPSITTEHTRYRYIRFLDDFPNSSNLEKATLYIGNSTTYEYYWAKTTPALEVLSIRADKLVELGLNTEVFLQLNKFVPQLLAVEKHIPKLIDTYTNGVPNNDLTIYNKLTELSELYKHLSQILSAQSHAQSANASAIIANTSATISQNAASLAEDAANRAEKAIATVATPTVFGLVKTSTPDDISNGIVGKVVDASQLKQQFDTKVVRATTSLHGIVKKATEQEIMARTGDGVITPETIDAYLPIGYDELDQYPRMSITENSNGLLRLTITDNAQQDKYFRFTGKLTVPYAGATVRVVFPSEIVPNSKCVLGKLIGAYTENYSIHELPNRINSLEHVDIGIYKADTDSWVEGEFYADISVRVKDGLLPTIPLGVKIVSKETGSILINTVTV